MTSKKTVKGTVVSGVGKAVMFTQIDWVKDQCQKKLGFVPYPGTLNVKVDPEYVAAVKAAKKKASIDLCPPSAAHCEAKCFRILLKRKPAAVVIPTVPNYPDDILEIIAPVKLKEAYAIKDGDSLTVSVEQDNQTKGA